MVCDVARDVVVEQPRLVAAVVPHRVAVLPPATTVRRPVEPPDRRDVAGAGKAAGQERQVPDAGRGREHADARARAPRSVRAWPGCGSRPAIELRLGDIGPEPIHQDQEGALHTVSGAGGATATTGTTASIGSRFICRILKIMTPRNSEAQAEEDDRRHPEGDAELRQERVAQAAAQDHRALVLPHRVVVEHRQEAHRVVRDDRQDAGAHQRPERRLPVPVQRPSRDAMSPEARACPRATAAGPAVPCSSTR